MIFGKVDRHLQRNSKEKECESPVWKHIYFHHQAIALNKQNVIQFNPYTFYLDGWLRVYC